MLWPSNATVLDRNGQASRAHFTSTPLQLRSGMTRLRGQISFEDEAGNFDFDGNFLLRGDDGTELVIFVQGILGFRAGGNQTFEFHRVREPRAGASWPEPGD